MEMIDVADFRGIPIQYDTDKKQFVAKVHDLKIRKATQRDVEKEILKLVDPSKRIKAILVKDRHWIDDLSVEIVEVLGERNGNIQYLEASGGRSKKSYGENLLTYDQCSLDCLKELIKEHADWLKRWQKAVGKMKKVVIT